MKYKSCLIPSYLGIAQIVDLFGIAVCGVMQILIMKP